MNMVNKHIGSYLLGAMCLIFGWGSATILHECFHMIVAMSLGLDVSMGELTITTGSMFVIGDMTPAQTVLVAIAGSLGLTIVGVLLVKLSNDSVVRMIGIVFLCRSWVDCVPIAGLDGAHIAESVGYVVAYSIVIIEVLVCGGVIFEMVSDAKKQVNQSKRRAKPSTP